MLVLKIVCKSICSNPPRRSYSTNAKSILAVSSCHVGVSRTVPPPPCRLPLHKVRYFKTYVLEGMKVEVYIAAME